MPLQGRCTCLATDSRAGAAKDCIGAREYVEKFGHQLATRTAAISQQCASVDTAAQATKDTVSVLDCPNPKGKHVSLQREPEAARRRRNPRRPQRPKDIKTRRGERHRYNTIRGDHGV